MQLVPPAAKLAGGATIVTSSSVIGTTQLKQKFQSEGFEEKFEVSSWRQVSYKFSEIFGSKLRPTKAETYENLEKDEQSKWQDRWATMYSKRSEIKSKRFSFLVKEDFLKTKPTTEDDAKTAVTALNKDNPQEFIKNFYKECRDISQLIFGKISHPNHWKKIIKKFLEDVNKDTEEKEARYFRDAWVACSDSGNDKDIDEKWPHKKMISEKNDNRNWPNQK